jgi:hypothetical protein
MKENEGKINNDIINMTTPNPLKPQYFFIKGTIMKSYISRK